MRLDIYEHPPGAGKTHAFMKYMSETPSKFVYAVPTLKMVRQVKKDLRKNYPQLSVKVLTNETQDETITQWLTLNNYLLADFQIVLTTHATVLNNSNHFIGYELIIDELPKEVLQVRSLWTSNADAEQLKLMLSNPKLTAQRIAEFKQGSDELSQAKFDFLQSVKAKNLEPIIKQYGDKQCFHYVRIAPEETFIGFTKIHLLAATVQGTLPYIYFTQICGFTPVRGCVPVRGNSMSNDVVIYPLTLIEGERDFLSKQMLCDNFDVMVSCVKKHSEHECITVTNSDKQQTINDNKPLELIPSHAHGLNDYKTRTEAAVIYCANPNPFDIPFMKHFALCLGMPENSLIDAYAEQNSLDVVYQAVTRTAVRDIDNDASCAFYVSDERAANWLVRRFPNARIDYSLAKVITEPKEGAQEGNEHAKGKGCPVVAALKEFTSHKKAARLIKKFADQNDRKPDAGSLVDMAILKDAAQLARIPKGYCFRV